MFFFIVEYVFQIFSRKDKKAINVQKQRTINKLTNMKCFANIKKREGFF